jgi:hypothetical protein
MAGTGFSYGLGLQRIFLEALDPELRGQAFALQLTGLMTLQGVGPLVTGALTEVAPIPLTLAATGLATMLTAVLWHTRRGAAVRSGPAVSGVAGLTTERQ